MNAFFFNVWNMKYCAFYFQSIFFFFSWTFNYLVMPKHIFSWMYREHPWTFAVQLSCVCSCLEVKVLFSHFLNLRRFYYIRLLFSFFLLLLLQNLSKRVFLVRFIQSQVFISQVTVRGIEFQCRKYLLNWFRMIVAINWEKVGYLITLYFI